MVLNLSRSRLLNGLLVAVRWLRLLLIPPVGATLFLCCLFVRTRLWEHFGGGYYESNHTWFPEEIPGSTADGFGFAWAFSVFGFSVLFFVAVRLLATAAWKQTLGWLKISKPRVQSPGQPRGE
jgi:hypothetical protein